MDKIKAYKWIAPIIILFSFLAISSFLTKSPQVNPNKYTRITLHPEMVLNETVYGDARKLVDEQTFIKDPETDSYKPKSTWNPPSNKKRFLPFSAVIDLGQYHFISHIYLYDAEGKGKITISTGEPFKWKEKAIENLDRYQVWKLHPLNDTTRFIQIKLEEMTSTPEIVLYGSGPLKIDGSKQHSTLRKADGRLKSKPLTTDAIIGANAFIDDPLESMKALGFIREYHSWSWDEAKPQENAFAPSYAGGGSWNFDKYYETLRNAGIDVLICAQGSVDWLPHGREAKPVPPDKSSTSPASYASHADHMFQLVARYGSNKIADDLLKLKVDQDKVSGLGLVKYFENWNEPNNDWSAVENYFTPYEFAAMSSADYDGHLGTLGKDKGLKNADPSAQMVMGGLASLNKDYLKAIKFWSDHNRAGSIPFDIINLHHYSNNRDVVKGSEVKGISPEEDSLKYKLKEVVKFRDAEMPDKEIWLTEFGYDTNPNSPQGTPQIGTMDPYEVQAVWLVRSYLAIAASGINRASMYMLRDVSESGRKYQTSGLITSKTAGKQPKPSWYYVFTLKNNLKGMIFKKDIERPDLFIYIFEDPNNNEKAYVAWSPTSEDKIMKNYSFSIEENKTTDVDIIRFSKESTTGVTSTTTAKDGQLLIDVSETPIIIKVKK